ncbi:MAG: S41 family peptidase [Thermaerobacter sp.]|nr:S41 family peptidase [Thermaerobacter sp.]
MDLTREDMSRELDQLVTLLIESHPDPYRAVGGPVSFHRAAAAIRAGLPESCAPREWLARLRPFVALLQDGHTTIEGEEPASDAGECLPLAFGVLPEGLYVTGVGPDVDSAWLGARLEAVARWSAAELYQRTRTLLGCDNHLDVWRRLALATRQPTLWQAITDAAPGAPAPLTLTLTDGTRATGLLAWTRHPRSTLRQAPGIGGRPKRGPTHVGWHLVGDGRVACLTMGSLMHYREAGEVWWATGYHEPLWQRARALGSGGPLTPEALMAVVSDMPSATAVLHELWTAMQASRTESLVVDLTAAPGGNSVLSGLLAFAAYGLDALVRSDGGYQIPRYSPLYRANYGSVPTAVPGSGGYDFGQEAAWRTAQDDPARRAALGHADWSALLQQVPTFASAVDTWPTWHPRVVVVTSAFTYSAGFDLALRLRQLGAQHVGVASAQAPNCFIDVLRYRLDRSGFTGTISFKESWAIPDAGWGSRTLEPDVSLTYDDVVRFGGDAAAELRLALELVQTGAL